MSRRRPYKPHRQEFMHARFRRESIWQRIKREVHEHTPYIGIRLDDFLP